MKLYHGTTAASASAILAEGFRDAGGFYGTLTYREGVWLSDQLLDINEGAEGEVYLVVLIPEKALVDFEWIREGAGYREWLAPADVVNRYRVARASHQVVTARAFRQPR
jgi:hypothetical protein